MTRETPLLPDSPILWCALGAFCAAWGAVPQTMHAPALGVVCAVATAIGCAWLIRRGDDGAHHARRAAWGIIGAMGAIASIGLHTLLTTDLPAPLHAEQRLEVATLTILTGPQRYAHGWRTTASLDEADATVQLWIDADLVDRAPVPGDQLTGAVRLRPWPPTDLPHHIDRRRLMRQRGVWSRADLRVVDEHTCCVASVSLRIRRALATQRLAAEEAILKALPQAHAAYVLAMLLGSKGMMHPAQRAPFDLTGTSHLLAISGLHLGALAALLWMLARAWTLWAPRASARHGTGRVWGAPIAVLLLAYVVMIGAPLSARRALLMLGSLLGAHVWRRRMSGLDALGLALCCVVWWAPYTAREPALWLSAGATGAILVAARHWRAGRAEDGAASVLSWREGVLVSLAAFVGTAPAVLALNAELPMAGIPLNILFVPIVSLVIFPLMILGGMLLLLSPTVGAWPLSVAARAMEVLHAVAARAATLDGASLRVGMMTPWMLGLFTAGVALVLIAWPQRGKRAVGALMMCAALAMPALVERASPAHLRIDFIPVGQGDATLIHFPDGETLLIDGGGQHVGPDVGLRRVMPLLRRRGVHRLDAVMLTHADVDHMRGLFAPAALATPRRFLYDPRQLREDEAVRLHREMRRWGAQAVPITATHQHAHGEASVRIIRPDPEVDEDAKNDQSLVVEVQYAGHRVLLTGDLEVAGEAWLVDRGVGRSTVVKMGHHGSKTSSTDALLDATAPQLAIGSMGRANRFGHPHREVVERYWRRGAHVLRTDQRGLISVEIDATGRMQVRTAR